MTSTKVQVAMEKINYIQSIVGRRDTKPLIVHEVG
jgi:hypothetical protein